MVTNSSFAAGLGSTRAASAVPAAGCEQRREARFLRARGSAVPGSLAPFLPRQTRRPRAPGLPRLPVPDAAHDFEPDLVDLSRRHAGWLTIVVCHHIRRPPARNACRTVPGDCEAVRWVQRAAGRPPSEARAREVLAAVLGWPRWGGGAGRVVTQRGRRCPRWQVVQFTSGLCAGWESS
jgi:hypothetical protein